MCCRRVIGCIVPFLLLLVVCLEAEAFIGTTSKRSAARLTVPKPQRPTLLFQSGSTQDTSPIEQKSQQDGDNKAMKFLKKIGKVGGSANRDLRFAIGVDEGSSGKSMGSSSPHSGPLKKTHAAFRSCVDTGTIDDLTEAFPTTSCGTQWSGVTDRVVGGKSNGHLSRETDFFGRTANVLRGTVVVGSTNAASLPNSDDKSEIGFIQMATRLSNQNGEVYVDASKFDGLELDVLCQANDDCKESESYNVHLKNAAVPLASYRASFDAPTSDWQTVRIPWKDFEGFGSDVPLDTASLARVGVVAIGRNMDVVLGIAGVRFYEE